MRIRRVILRELAMQLIAPFEISNGVTHDRRILLVEADVDGVTVVNARFAKPLDEALLLELERDHSHVITLEEHSLAGGFGAAVAEFVSDRGLNLRVERVGVPNVLVQHDSQDKQRALFGLNGEALAARVRQISESKSEKSVVRAR